MRSSVKRLKAEDGLVPNIYFHRLREHLFALIFEGKKLFTDRRLKIENGKKKTLDFSTHE